MTVTLICLYCVVVIGIVDPSFLQVTTRVIVHKLAYRWA